jgi:DNA-binding transcriptional LysR family regulator
VSLQLREIALAAESVRGSARDPGLTVSTTVSFAALWLIPRLAAFRAAQPAVEVYVSANDRMVDLARGDVDVAVRYLSDAGAPPGAARLFGERLLPVASPALRRRGRAPLREPSDLARHVLIHLDDPAGYMPWLNWPAWLTSNGQPNLKPAGSLRFSLYDQVIQAALGGQGVALGRRSLVRRYVSDGQLVVLFDEQANIGRAYYLVLARGASARPEVQRFMAWMKDEVRRERLPLKPRVKKK